MTEPADIYAESLSWFAENWDPNLALGEWWRRLADAGWAFPAWPIGYGGRGLSRRDARHVTRARHEVGAYGPPNGVATFLAAPTILHYGTKDQQDRYLPSIANGTHRWCQLFSEPSAGSDMAGLATRAERDGDEWIVTGQKVWNSGAHLARFGILIARTDPDQPKHKGISYFLIDMHQPGVEVRPLREMTGDAAFNEVFLTEARVPETDRLGELGEGWKIAMTTLSHERDPDNDGLGDSAAFGNVDLTMSVGDHAAAQAEQIDGFSLAMAGGVTKLLDSIVEDFGAADNATTRQELMTILSMRRTSRWSGQRAAAAAKAGGQPGPEISTLKLLGADIGRRIRDTGFDAMGPHAMLAADDAPERGLFHSYGLFTPAMSIAGGSDEVQRNIIGERVLGLAREPGEAEQRQQPWSDLPRS